MTTPNGDEPVKRVLPSMADWWKNIGRDRAEQHDADRLAKQHNAECEDMEARRKEAIREQIAKVQQEAVKRELAAVRLSAAKLAARQRHGLLGVLVATFLGGVVVGAIFMWLIMPSPVLTEPVAETVGPPAPYILNFDPSIDPIYHAHDDSPPGAQPSESEDLSLDQEAAAPPAPPTDIYTITCYSPGEGFLPTNEVARGGTVMYWYEYAKECGLDGICAVSPCTPWYERVREDPPAILVVAGFGRYLVVDRTARRVCVVDLWVPWQAGIDGPEWRVQKTVTETQWEEP